jgi:hypothetical protein
MRRSEFFNRRVAARVPINGDMINSGNLGYFFWYLFVEPTGCKVGKSIRGHFWGRDGRIALSRRIRRDWKGFIVLEVYFDSKLTVIIEALLWKEKKKQRKDESDNLNCQSFLLRCLHREKG